MRRKRRRRGFDGDEDNGDNDTDDADDDKDMTTTTTTETAITTPPIKPHIGQHVDNNSPQTAKRRKVTVTCHSAIDSIHKHLSLTSSARSNGSHQVTNIRPH